jgi:hypothetical protein
MAKHHSVRQGTGREDMHSLRIMMALLVGWGMWGCAVRDYEQGTKVSAQHLAAFTKGKTTRDEVVATLGGPQDITLEGGKQMLVYRYQRISAGLNIPNEGTDTTFIFTNQGVLEEVLQSRGTGQPHPLTGR